MILYLADDAHDTQDVLDQLSRMGCRLTTRLTLGSVVLARRFGFLLFPTSFLLESEKGTVGTRIQRVGSSIYMVSEQGQRDQTSVE